MSSYWGRPGATREEAPIRTYESGHDDGYELGIRDAGYASAAWAFMAGILLTAAAFLGLA